MSRNKKRDSQDRNFKSSNRQSQSGPIGKNLGKNVGKQSVRSKGRGQSARAVATPSRPAQVAAILDEVLTWQSAADQSVSRYFRANKQMGSRDRAEIAAAVFDVLRHLRHYRNLAQSGPGQLTLCLAWLGLYATLEKPREQLPTEASMHDWVAHCQRISPDTLSFAVRYSLPDWLQVEIERLPQPESFAKALLQSAPLDLRVNTFKSSRANVLEQIEVLRSSQAHWQAIPTPFSETGIRINANPPLEQWDLFKQGLIEVQDEGSQLLARLLDPKRHEMVIDYCAGAGGKTLALGAMMNSSGRLYAFDVSASRLSKAKPRFARSGLSNIHPVVIRPHGDDRIRRLAGKAHRVLVDAPCTGLGTLRRNPDLKWRQTPEVLENLCRQQQAILQQASQCVRPGGRLVYATCSWLTSENEDQVDAFLKANPDFRLIDARELLPETLLETEKTSQVPVVDSAGMIRLRPDLHGTDAFFAAVMVRDAST